MLHITSNSNSLTHSDNKYRIALINWHFGKSQMIHKQRLVDIFLHSVLVVFKIPSGVPVVKVTVAALASLAFEE